MSLVALQACRSLIAGTARSYKIVAMTHCLETR